MFVPSTSKMFVYAVRIQYRLKRHFRSRVFLSGNTHNIFFHVTGKKEEKAKCMQSNDKRISAAQIREIGQSHFTYCMYNCIALPEDLKKISN